MNDLIRLNLKALYTHCYSHRLNLSICDSLSIIEVTKILKHVKEVTNFIDVSQTRKMPFQKAVHDSCETDSKKTTLPDVCRTRKVERIRVRTLLKNCFYLFATCLTICQMETINLFSVQMQMLCLQVFLNLSLLQF